VWKPPGYLLNASPRAVAFPLANHAYDDIVPSSPG